MPLAPSDQLSFYPAGVVNPLFLRGIRVVATAVGLKKVRAGVEKRGGGAPGVAHAADSVAAFFNFGRRGGG
jgi:hypothetical protein